MIQSSQARGIGRAQRSQSLVEFSLSLVALIMLISGVVDLGRAFFVITAMEDTVGEGAVFLSQNPRCVGSAVSGCGNPNNAVFRMTSAGGGLLDFTHVKPSATTTAGDLWFKICWPAAGGSSPETYTSCSTTAPPVYGYDVGEPIYVEMNYNFQLWSPFIPSIARLNPLPLKVVATNVIVVK